MPAATAEDAAEALRVWLSVTEDATSTLPGLIAGALDEERSGDPLTLQPGVAVGPVDEIGMDIGPDESPGGLLDPLTWSGITGEPTSEIPSVSEENTGAVHEDTRINAPRTALLSRILGLSHEQPSPLRFQDGTPSAAIRERIASETLDPLPVPDGLPARPGSLLPERDTDWEENTATAIEGLSTGPGGLRTVPTPPTGVPIQDHDTAPMAAATDPGAEPERTEQTASIEVPNPLLAVAVMMAVIAGAAGLFLLLQQLQ